MRKQKEDEGPGYGGGEGERRRAAAGHGTPAISGASARRGGVSRGRKRRRRSKTRPTHKPGSPRPPPLRKALADKQERGEKDAGEPMKLAKKLLEEGRRLQKRQRRRGPANCSRKSSRIGRKPRCSR